MEVDKIMEKLVFVSAHQWCIIYNNWAELLRAIASGHVMNVSRTCQGRRAARGDSVVPSLQNRHGGDYGVVSNTQYLTSVEVRVRRKSIVGPDRIQYVYLVLALMWIASLWYAVTAKKCFRACVARSRVGTCDLEAWVKHVEAGVARGSHCCASTWHD
jgi:hypothetical protein